MGLVLDTSVIIGAEKGQLSLPKLLLKESPDEAAYISSITASELLHGVERANSSTRKTQRSEFVEALLNDFVTLGFGLSEARIHSQIWSSLKEAGMLIGPHDLLIAATALANRHSVATLNVGEFERISALNVIDAGQYL